MNYLESLLAARQMKTPATGCLGKAAGLPGVSVVRGGLRGFGRMLALAGLLVIAACPAVWAQWEAQPPPALRFPPQSTRAVPFRDARYRGTLGNQPVTVQLSVADDEQGNPTLIRGSVRFDSSATMLHELRSWRAYRATAPLQLVEADSTRLNTPVGFWKTDQPAGSRLSGTWTGPAGEKRRFELHEDYHDQWGKLAAVRYEVVTKEYVVIGGEVLSSNEWIARTKNFSITGSLTPRGIYSQAYLHFLGPDTLRPAVANMQCPPPAERGGEAQLRATEKLKRLTEGQDNSYSSDYSAPEEEVHYVWVHYLDHGLLSLSEDNSYCSGHSACSHSFSNGVYDLNDGEMLLLDDIVQPGALVALSRLLGRHLRADDQYNGGDASAYGNEPEPVALPVDNQFGIVENGLRFHYSDWELPAYRWGPEIVVPWAELLPLLRPDSPVARMLRERGLWPARKAGL